MADRKTPWLTLDRVGFTSAEGRTILDGLSEQFDGRATGLVGRNGAGKSLLAKLLAGELAPSRGQVLRHGRIHHLPQQQSASTVAELAGLAAPLAALDRIERGGCAPADFEAVADRWDLREHWQSRLRAEALPAWAPGHPAAALSGGERMRVALAGALASGAELLILDEPSNHLDGRQRERLAAALRDWPGGLLLISHDRALLAPMAAIVEIGPAGLTRYGGGYEDYVRLRAEAEAAALAGLETARRERRRGEARMAAERERQQRRQAQGRRVGRETNQARILLDFAKGGSEHSQGRLQRQHAQQGEALAARQQAAFDDAQAWHQDTPLLWQTPACWPAGKPLAELQGAVLPHVDMRPLDWLLHGPLRVAIAGPNGCGKSSLLKLLAGRLAPASGRCSRSVDAAYLDQELQLLDGARPLLAQLLERAPRAGEALLRTRLAQLGLGPEQVLQPSAQLSGGERLKAALALLLYADAPAPWLLLDEPSNHLDLPSLRAVEAMLSQYRGALCVVSHDERFLDALGLTQRLEFSAGRWDFRPVSAPPARR